MILSRKNMHVIQGAWDPNSGNPWYKIRVDIPEIHLETPQIMTMKYGEDLIEKIDKAYIICPHCGKQV